MRSARTLFASAAVTAVLAVATPAAYALTSSDGWDNDSGSSSSSSSGNNDHREKPDSWKHEKPEGGVHTGGGFLAAITADGAEKDGDGSSSGNSDREKPESWNKEESAGSGESSESWKHEKPEGGVHTGGGAMALSGSSLAAGSALMLGGIGAGVYRLRRRGTSGTAAV